MPRVVDKKLPNTGMKKHNVLNMMGIDDDENDDMNDDAFEQELAAIMGGASAKKPAAKKPPQKLVDWSVLNAQVEESLKDVDDDVEVTSDDELDLMDELNDIVGEDELTVKPAAPVNRSPSPIPAKAATDVLSVLKSRKEMYELGVKQSTMASKTRRLQRGLKQIDEMITQAKRGKNIVEDEIPPPIAVTTTATSQQPNAVAPQVPVVQQPPVQQKPLPTPQSISQQPENVASTSKSSVSSGQLKLLEDRLNQYKAAAMKAKQDDNRDLALQHFRTMKEIDFIIKSAKEGKPVDLAQMPFPPNSAGQSTTVNKPSVAAESAPKVTNETKQATTPAAASPQQPKTPAEHLQVRLKVYQTSANEASKSGNSGKARRMMRIVKQYEDALKSHKLGRKVDFNELPCPPGFPPIPGQAQQPDPVNLLERANQLANADPDAEEPQQEKLISKAQPSSSSSVATTAGRSAAPKPQTVQNAQLVFLKNRQLQFRQAALKAKENGNRKLALEYLKKTKGFDPLIEATMSGVKVDISKVPQPPIVLAKGGATGKDFQAADTKAEKNYATLEAKNDAELYTRIVTILTQQIKKARLYSEQMTHAGDVRAAQLCDSLATSSQADLDYIVSCRRYKDPPPRFFYQEKNMKCMEINPDVGENELQLTIVQCIGVSAVVKDSKTLVEWEMPFPNDNPAKGKTDEAQPSPNPRFNSVFRIPFNRKNRSNQRAIKSKSMRLNFIAKGGFLRSDKTLGICNMKLAPLDTSCTFHTVEKLKEGRDQIGEIELKVHLRTPITSSGPKPCTEKWMVVEQAVRKKPTPAPAPKPSAQSSSSNEKAASQVNISSIQAALIDFKLVTAQIDLHKKRNQQVPREMILEAKRIKNQIDSTRTYIQDGGSNAKKEYYHCLTKQYEFLTKQAEQHDKDGNKGKAKISRKKKEVISAELQKYKS